MVNFKDKSILASIIDQTRNQTAVLPNNGSYDPTYPRWTFEQGKSYLMYIPRVFREDGTGTYIEMKNKKGDTIEVLNDDKPLIHQVLAKYDNNGKISYYRRPYRCINGLTLPAFGYDAAKKMCPLCEAAQDSSKLRREQVEAAHPGENLSGQDWTNAADKFDSTRLVTAIRGGDDQDKSRNHVFPVGVVEVKRDEDDGSFAVVSEEPKMYFMVATNGQWQKWKSAYRNNMVPSPVGHWFLVSYPDGQGVSKMNSGRDMTVNLLVDTSSMESELAPLAKHFNAQCDGHRVEGDKWSNLIPEDGSHPWTLDVIWEKVGACVFHPYDELARMHDEFLSQNSIVRLGLEGGSASAPTGIDAPKVAGGGIQGKATAPQINASDLLGAVDTPTEEKKAEPTTPAAEATPASADNDFDELNL